MNGEQIQAIKDQLVQLSEAYAKANAVYMAMDRADAKPRKAQQQVLDSIKDDL